MLLLFEPDAVSGLKISQNYYAAGAAPQTPLGIAAYGSTENTGRENDGPSKSQGVKTQDIVGLVYNYRNSLSENFTGDAKNVL